MEAAQITLVMTLRNVESCSKANLVVFGKAMTECELQGDTKSGGVSECVYKCYDTCSSIVNIGFQEPRLGPPTWTICTVAEIRNKIRRVIDLSL